MPVIPPQSGGSGPATIGGACRQKQDVEGNVFCVVRPKKTLV
jgi:hypothetical protein